MAENDETKSRIPPEIDGIQVNFCKNPACGNFYTPASTSTQSRGRYAKDENRDTYTLKGKSHKLALQCTKCSENPPVKSNKGIKEEIDRISAYLIPDRRKARCPNSQCINHLLDADVFDYRDRYRPHGKTSIGSPRFQCKECGKTFSVPQKSTHRQRKSHVNIRIFQDLLGKKPLRTVAGGPDGTVGVDVSMNTLYDKIDFIYRQCLAFAASREKKLPELKRAYVNISVDRQMHSINWRDCKDRRNVILYAIGSADRNSRYVFGVHLNFDPSVNTIEIEKDAVASGDYELQRPFRKYARFWLENDYEEAKTINERRTSAGKEMSLDAKIEDVYKAALSRQDVEACDKHNTDTRLPLYGMQVHAEYTMYAHFFFLRKMLSGIGKIRFYLDQDSGIRAACLAAFADRILEKTCDACYVTIKTDYTQNQRYALSESGKVEKEEFLYRHPEYKDLHDVFIRREIIKERLWKMREIGGWRDKWLEYPFPNMSEPDKMVCYLTNIKKGSFDRDMDGMAYIFERATLHPIDCFFMQCRRGVSILDRSVRSSSRSGRVWQLYNAYDPGIVVKLLEIYRVYYNYVKATEGRKRPKGAPRRKPGEAKKAMKTPAMRLGLAKGPISLEDILYFKTE